MAKKKYKRKSRAKTPGATRGKPKFEFIDAQMKKIKAMAFLGCHNETIARVIEVPTATLQSRPDIQVIIKKKRAEHRVDLRKTQNKLSKSNPAMAIFLGKNELEQTDRQDINLGGNVSITLEREK